MKLFIKQKVLSFKDKFTVKNEAGADKYNVEGKLISVGKKLRVTDSTGNEVAYIEQKVMSLKPKYKVYQNDKVVAEIVKEFTLLKPKYSILGPDWKIEGNFWGHEYQITQQGKPIVSISKALLSWGDSYLLDIQDTADEVLALSCVIAIDCAMADK